MEKPGIVSTLQRLISGIRESIVIFDETGTILHTSKNLQDLFGVEHPEGLSVFDFLVSDMDEVRAWLTELTHAHFLNVKVRMVRRDETFPAYLRMVAWELTEGGFVVLGSITDGTFLERRKRDLLRKTLIIEQLSKSRKIRSGKLYDAIQEILEMSSRAVNTERVNAWLFSEDGSRIECIGNFDSSVAAFVPQEGLPRINTPRYFELFETRKIIVASDARNSPDTMELLDSYLIPNNIYSMMDVPLRIEGEIIGVICFEQVGRIREWKLQDQKFGLIAAQMVSLAVETHKRKMAQFELESALRRQRQLMFETNHRIKNNLAIVSSLMRLQMEKCMDDYHKGLLQDSVNRINSIAVLHELLSSPDGVHRVSFEPYAHQLIEGLRESFSNPEQPIQLMATIENCEISGSLAITLGLIINETVTNAYKHAFAGQMTGMIRVDLTLNGTIGQLTISDTGKGFDENTVQGQGFEIIQGLARHIDAEVTTSSVGGSTVMIDFRLR